MCNFHFYVWLYFYKCHFLPLTIAEVVNSFLKVQSNFNKAIFFNFFFFPQSQAGQLHPLAPAPHSPLERKFASNTPALEFFIETIFWFVTSLVSVTTCKIFYRVSHNGFGGYIVPLKEEGALPFWKFWHFKGLMSILSIFVWEEHIFSTCLLVLLLKGNLVHMFNKVFLDISGTAHSTGPILVSPLHVATCLYW